MTTDPAATHDPGQGWVSSTSHDCVLSPFPDSCITCDYWERAVWLAERAAKSAQGDTDRRTA